LRAGRGDLRAGSAPREVATQSARAAPHRGRGFRRDVAGILLAAAVGVPTFHKILVPTDFSAHSGEAIKIAAAMSHAMHAPLVLLSVYQPPSMPLIDGAVLPLDVGAEVARVNSQLQEAEQAAKQAGAVGVSSSLRQGGAVDEILAHAKEEGIDLIVMGTHGRTGLKHALLGSVAEKIVRRSPCAVLTVHAPKEN
jgi:universal stress protein A